VEEERVDVETQYSNFFMLYGVYSYFIRHFIVSTPSQPWVSQNIEFVQNLKFKCENLGSFWHVNSIIRTPYNWYIEIEIHTSTHHTIEFSNSTTYKKNCLKSDCIMFLLKLFFYHTGDICRTLALRFYKYSLFLTVL
jgi:hypothetical protein